MAAERGVRAGLVFGLLLTSLPWVAHAQESGPTVVIRGTLTDNTIDVLGDVQRDLVGAGGTINVRRLVRGDVTFAGGSVNLSGRVGDDVRAAGGTVWSEARWGATSWPPEGPLRSRQSPGIADRAWLSGGRVTVAGRVTRELRVAAASVSVAGEVDGDVRIAARIIEVLHWTAVSGHSMIVVERCSRGAGSRAPSRSVRPGRGRAGRPRRVTSARASR